jgi:O-antigen/teichoic acid export membrane protein
LVLLTRLLSPADFGLVSAALVVIGFSLIFSQLGLGPALVQRPILEPRHVSTAFYASTGLGLVFGAAIWLAAPLIAQFFRMDHLVPVVRWLAFIFPLAGTAAVPDSLLQRELRFRLLANRDVLAYAVSHGVVGVVLALLGWGVWALVTAQLTQHVIRTAILLAAAPPLLRAQPTWESFLELMKFGAGLSASRIGVLLGNQADNLVVGRWLGAVALGLYSRAYQLMSVPTALFGDILDKVLFPTMARVQDDQRRLASAYLQGTALIALVTLPAGVVAAVLAPDLIPVAFGSRWEALIPPFQVLALGMLFRTSYRMSDSLSRATGRVYRRAWRQWLYAGLVFLGAWIGHYRGVSGVAIGVLSALIINYLLMAQLSLSVTRVSWLRFAQAQLPGLLLAVLCGAASLGATFGARYLGLPQVGSLLAGLLAAGGTAALTISIAPRVALGQHGLRVRDTIRAYLSARLGPARLPGST